MEITARTAYRGQVTKITNAANEYLASPESKLNTNNDSRLDEIQEELVSFIQRLTSAQDNLIAVDREIKENDLLKPEECEKVADYQDLAINTLSRLQCRLQNLQKRQTPTITSAQNVNNPKRDGSTRLERLKLQKFSGQSAEWLPFWQQFSVAVHENSSLTGAEKFQYLQTVLTGNAEKTIAGFKASEECYDSAIALLQEEYGDNQKLIDITFHQLMSLSPVMSETDVVSLRALYNSIVSSTRTLTALNVPPNNYSIMLKTILLKALPNKLKVGYYRYCEDSAHNNQEGNNVTLQTNTKHDDSESVNESSFSALHDGGDQVKSILKYLKREVDSLERALPTNSAKALFRNRSKAAPSTAAGLVAFSNTMKCLFCQSSSHVTKDCDGNLSIEQKKRILQRNGSCFRCTTKGHTSRKCKVFSTCKRCSRSHATSMCDPNFSARNEVKTSLTGEKNSSALKNKEAVTLHSAVDNSVGINNVFLKTARAFSIAKNKQKILVRLIIDGGSQRSYIRQAVADRLKLPVIGTEKVSVLAFGDEKISGYKDMKKVIVTLKSQFNDKSIDIVALIVPEICIDVLAEPNLECEELNKMSLADVNKSGSKQVDGLSILIGADFYWQVVTGLQKTLTNRLKAIETVFGWTLHGPVPPPIVNMCAVTRYCFDNYDQTNFTNFWSLELLGIQSASEESGNVSKELQENCIFRTGQRYTVSLPWKNLTSSLHSNRAGALKRLEQLVKRLSRNPEDLLQYHKAVREFIAAGFAEPIENEEEGFKPFYLPHRPVYRPDKETTKIRVVFDASAHAPGMSSLNEQLHTGTNLLPDLLQILLRFRMGHIGLVADVEKAFLQILLSERDRDSHRFFWFESKGSTDEIDLQNYKVYRITRVTFGVTCSPFLLSAVIKMHLNNEINTYPETAKLLLNSFYMDDLILSVDNSLTAQRIYTDSMSIMANAGMHLRKWTTNATDVCDIFNDNITVNQQKILGVIWHISTDELSICLDSANEFIKGTPPATKRGVLQFLSRIFDPFGILAPIVVKQKLLFQNAWKENLDWDANLPDHMLKEWNRCLMDIPLLQGTTLPRCVFPKGNVINRQLHIFADASAKAFGAVAYIRSQTDEDIYVEFLCAKSRIAPLNKTKRGISDIKDKPEFVELTAARLELTAAMIASRLCSYIKTSVNIKFNSTHLWSDSKITLYWIYGEEKKWQPFVTNRLREIRILTNKTDWKHCAGRNNPADLLTRGISAAQFLKNDLWFQGPAWLRQDTTEWPPSNLDTVSKPTKSITLFRVHVEPTIQLKEPILPYEKFSCWNRLLRVTCYVMRFVKIILKSASFPLKQYLDEMELADAERYWISFVQITNYSNEIDLLQKGKAVDRTSSLWTLCPFVDEKGLLRIRSRLQFANVSLDSITPIILPKSSHISKLIVIDAHHRTFHRGVNIVLTKLRERFWILRARQLTKTVINQCYLCRRMHTKPMDQPFAPLPRDRVSLARPFEATGVDFAGPLYIPALTDKNEITKVYIMIFTCAAIRAIHLELVLSLSTENCILAMRRFVSRRGCPRVIYSDNAKTFKRASLELSQLDEIFKSVKFQAFLSLQRLKWRFIVERAPWWGGFWERLIRVVKDILKIAIGRAKLNYDQLQTLLIEAEDVVNSRPLTYVSDDPLDMAPLTPNSFLKGALPWIRSREELAEATSEDIKGLWKSRLKSLDILSKRWSNEYLKALRAHHHCKQASPSFVKVGDVVMVQDTAVPRIHWKLARIECVYPGRDNRIRACLVRLADGSTLRRPIQMLYPLEMQGRSGPEDVKNVPP